MKSQFGKVYHVGNTKAGVPRYTPFGKSYFRNCAQRPEPKENQRRKRQIATGQLTKANGLTTQTELAQYKVECLKRHFHG